jgi:hypothetical protein
MRPALDPAGHRVPRPKPTGLLHTWRSHRRRPFALVLHLHQHQSSHNLHLQYLAKNQSTQRCQPLITQGSNIHRSSNHTWSSGTPSFSKSPASSLAFARGLRRGRTALAGASRSNLLCGGGGSKGAVRAKTQI